MKLLSFFPQVKIWFRSNRPYILLLLAALLITDCLYVMKSHHLKLESQGWDSVTIVSFAGFLMVFISVMDLTNKSIIPHRLSKYFLFFWFLLSGVTLLFVLAKGGEAKLRENEVYATESKIKEKIRHQKFIDSILVEYGCNQ